MTLELLKRSLLISTKLLTLFFLFQYSQHSQHSQHSTAFAKRSKSVMKKRTSTRSGGLKLIMESKICRTIDPISRNGLRASAQYTEKPQMASAAKPSELIVKSHNHCDRKFEASGIISFPKGFYIVFDNMPNILMIPSVPEKLSLNGGNFTSATDFNGAGFEGVAFNSTKNSLLLLTESKKIESNFLVGGVTEIPISKIPESASGYSARLIKSGHKAIMEYLVVDRETEEISSRFSKKNKGYEGISYLSGDIVEDSNPLLGARPGQRQKKYDYLFVLCEGNFCATAKSKRLSGKSLFEGATVDPHFYLGKKPKKGHKIPGHGQIHIYRKQVLESSAWSNPLILELGSEIPFQDYSGMDIVWQQAGSSSDEKIIIGDILIVSQESKQLWVGQLRLYFDPRSKFKKKSGDGKPIVWHAKKTFGLSLSKGHIYNFLSHTSMGLAQRIDSKYCNIEGVSWVGSPSKRTIAVVSDAYKSKKQPDLCKSKEQSIHIFSF